MVEVRYIDGPVGPEIVDEIGTGLIINNARWSGPAQVVKSLALKAAPDAGILRIFVIDHDLADGFIRLFDRNGWSPCQGWGDLIFVHDGIVKRACHKFESMTEIDPWLRSVATP